MEPIKEHLEHIRIRLEQQDELNTRLTDIHNKIIDITKYIKKHEEQETEQVQGLENKTAFIPSTSSEDELPKTTVLDSSSESEESEHEEEQEPEDPKLVNEKLPFTFLRENNAAYLS